MGPFDLFSAGTARGNLNGALHQSYDELALVVGGSAHVRLGIGGGASGFGGGGNRLVVQVFPRSAVSASVARIAVSPTQPRAMAAS